MLCRFVFGTRFLHTYHIDEEMVDVLKHDDEVLLQLGFDWLKNAMFNGPTIALRDEVLQQATRRPLVSRSADPDKARRRMPAGRPFRCARQ